MYLLARHYSTFALGVRSASFARDLIVLCFLFTLSKFLDSNWILFGIETLVVLLVSVLTAFVLGSALSNVVALPSSLAG